MRGVLLAALACSLSLAFAQSLPQVTIDEPAIRAVPEDGTTVVTLPVYSAQKESINAQIKLEWLGPDNRIRSSVHESVQLEPGKNQVAIPFRLPTFPSIWLRLRYQVSPAVDNIGAFFPTGGIVAVSEIASHVFELKLTHAGIVQPGAPYVVYGQAVHPVTRKPMPDASFAVSMEIEERAIPATDFSVDEAGIARWKLRHPGRRMEDFQLNGEVRLSATLADFSAVEEDQVFAVNFPSARIQTDKPLFQPGQTIHVRPWF